MNRRSVIRQAAVPLVALATLLGAVPARAEAHADVGTTVEEAKLESIAGGKQPLLGKADVHVLLFIRPYQDRSADVMKQLAKCEKKLAEKPVRVVGLVSSSVAKDEVQAFVKEVGTTIPVLVDENDELYGKLEIRQHPIAILVDQAHKVTAVQPYTRLRFCEVLFAHVQFLLKEISQEQLAAVVDPPKAVMPSDDKGAVANRHVVLGEKFLAKGNCALAAKQFEDALAIDPANARAQAGKAKCAGGGAEAKPAAADSAAAAEKIPPATPPAAPAAPPAQ